MINKQKGKFIIWKDGTWMYIKDGRTWEYESDKDWLLTINLNEKETFIDQKKYPK